MRASDLLRLADVAPDGISDFIDLTTGAFDVRPMLAPAMPTMVAGPDTLRVAAFSSSPSPSHSTFDDVARLDLDDAELVLLLARETVIDLSIPRLLSWMGDARLEVAAIGTLRYRWFSTGFVLRPVASEAPALLVTNENRVRREAQKILTHRLKQAEHRRARAERALNATVANDIKTSAAVNDAVRHAQNLQAETTRQREIAEQLERTIFELKNEVRKLETVEESTSYRLGRLLTTSIKPSRKTLELPKELRSLWQNRGSWKNKSDSRPLETSRSADDHRHRDARLMWAFRADDPLPHPPSALAMISSNRTDRLTSAWGNTRTLLPNDAEAILAGDEFGLLVIESGATLPGGPWASLGQPNSRHLDLLVLALLDQARTRNIRTAFWWTTEASAAPRLRELAERCDHRLVAPGLSSVPAAHVLPVPADLGAVEAVKNPPFGVGVFADSDVIDLRDEVPVVQIGPSGYRYDWLRTSHTHRQLAEVSHAVLPQQRGRPTSADVDTALISLAAGLRTLAGPSGIHPELDEHCVSIARRADVPIALETAPSTVDRKRQIASAYAFTWSQRSWPTAVCELLSELKIDQSGWDRMQQYSVIWDRDVASSIPEAQPSRFIAALDRLPIDVVFDDDVSDAERAELDALGVRTSTAPISRFTVGSSAVLAGATIVNAALGATLKRQLRSNGRLVAADTSATTTTSPWWLEDLEL